MVKHFYHLYCSMGTPDTGRSPWRQILSEHLNALPPGWELSAGMVGEAVERYEARQMIRALFPAAQIAVQAVSGHEQLTLDALWQWSKTVPPHTPVLYAHSKGVTHPPGDPLVTAWRQSMARNLVGRWEECVRLLEDHDAVGCHWLVSPTHPTLGQRFFGGNFWWARAGYVAGLPPPGGENRWVAETWIGLNDPHVADLLPGWPSMELFAAAAQ